MSIQSKRCFLKISTLALTGAGLAAASGAALAAPSNRLPFVMVHGAFHGAWTFDKVVALLAAKGTLAFARDLPAHGLKALYPSSYFQRPLDFAAFATEPGPSAGTTLNDYVDSVIETIEQVHALTKRKVILLAHSMGGVAASAVAEKIPHRIAKLVYLTAFMPPSGVPAIAYINHPANAGEEVKECLLANPEAVGVMRMDQRSNDPAYRAKIKSAFCGDLPDAQFEAVANLLTPDVPAQPFVTPIELTAGRWGALERHYVQCLQDNAIKPALQQLFINEADAFTPKNLTHVHQLDSSHSPFMSKPQELVALLEAIAAG